MTIETTGFDGLVVLVPDVFHDPRGYFLESFRESVLADHGINDKFVQDNLSFSRKDVIRGLHLQRGDWSQAKIVTVMSGKVVDVVVDLRSSSPTFGKHFKIELDDQNRKSLYIPEGFAHGFGALEDSVFYYKCSQYYHRESEAGIRWNDPELGIDWGIENPQISEKDQQLPGFSELMNLH